MARSLTWVQSRKISIASGASWTLPVSQNADGSGCKTAFAQLLFEALSGGGTLTVKLQAALYSSLDPAAWVTIAEDTISASGMLVFLVGPAATNPVTGHLRLKIDCATATTVFVLRADLLLKAETGYRLVEWLPATSISVTAGTDVTMPADQWAEVGPYVQAFVLAEFDASSGSGSDLSVFVETAASRASETGSFVEVDSATLSATSTQIDGVLSSTNPPMGVLRLRYSSGNGLVSGTLRVMLLVKDDN